MMVKEHTWQGSLPEARDGSAMTQGDKEDNIDDESVITLTKPWDRAQSLWHFTLTKKYIMDHVLDSSEILHKLTEKSLPKQAAEEKTQTF
jgi:hypothetical protein